MKIKIEYLKPVIEEIEVDDKFAELIKIVKEANARSDYPWATDSQARNIEYKELDPQNKGLRSLWAEVCNNCEYEVDTIYTDDGIVIS